MSFVKPAPYPGDTRAKGWRFEIDMEKVRQSDTWALTLLRGYEPKALLIWMWSVAWEQTPCGSFPNDEALIAARLELPPEVWERNRSILLRNWWLADDGRLYHDVIVTRVLAMLEKRASDAQRAANRRARLAESSGHPPGLPPESRVTPVGSGGEFDTKHQAPVIPGTGTKTPLKPPRKRRGAASQADFVSLEQMVAEGVDPQVAADWLTVRATKALPLTPTAWEDTKAEAAKAGMTIGEAVRYSTTRSRGGFRASWVRGDEALDVMRTGPATTTPPNRQEAVEQRNRTVADDWAARHEGVPT